jgi:nuclear GTP-binding protein
VPNIAAAAMTVVTDWRDGRIQGWIDPPVSAPAAAGVAGKVADEKVMADQKVIVTEWAKEFKLEGLWEDEAATEGEGNEVEMQ